MLAQGLGAVSSDRCLCASSTTTMAPKAKAGMKAGANAMSKGAIAEALAAATELKKSECTLRSRAWQPPKRSY